MPHIMSTFIVEILKKDKYSIHLPPSTFIFLSFFSSFPPSPKLFVAETTNSYSLPFSKLTTTLRSDVSVISFILIQFSDVPSSRTVLQYTVYWVIGTPLFSASFHFKVILTSFVLAGKSVISAAAGTPGLKDEWYKVKKKNLFTFGCIDSLATLGCGYFESANGCPP